MSTDIARARMISELTKLAEEFQSTAAGLGELRIAEGMMDAETKELIDRLLYTSSRLRDLAGEAE
ncbi:hypothetical protein [Pseudomonas sp. CCC4.4]|uniref:hypothetical protein n=1 Tax=Pseudomonas sp. CCC4.4 TaxID=3048612 RepID=UPI002B23E5FC|nr:hypothetical protein [Pseudomonas sp. CCC4.4]MEB0170048.1 hypothetical protein [Pseudomonas sp. CCC4.4]